MTEQEQQRKIRHRLGILRHAEEVSGNPGAGGGPRWPRFRPQTDKRIVYAERRNSREERLLRERAQLFAVDLERTALAKPEAAYGSGVARRVMMGAASRITRLTRFPCELA